MGYTRIARGHGRSPRGERGLKSILASIAEGGDLSLPARGAWVEMSP